MCFCWNALRTFLRGTFPNEGTCLNVTVFGGVSSGSLRYCPLCTAAVKVKGVPFVDLSAIERLDRPLRFGERRHGDPVIVAGSSVWSFVILLSSRAVKYQRRKIIYRRRNISAASSPIRLFLFDPVLY